MSSEVVYTTLTFFTPKGQHLEKKFRLVVLFDI